MTFKKLLPGFFLLLVSSSVLAHHVLGRPSYSLSEDSNTPPSMQIETRIGKYLVTMMAFPAFPQPNQPGRIHLYASRIQNEAPFAGEVTFKVRDDSWFSSKTEVIGKQKIDDVVFRQGFEFKQAGNYIITAEFESDGEPYIIDFPIRIGDPWPIGPVGVSVAALILLLITVNIVQRRRIRHRKVNRDQGAESKKE